VSRYLNQPGGILDTARQEANKRGHDVVAGYERTVDVIQTYCFNCGAEITVGLNDFGQEGWLSYDETLEVCRYVGRKGDFNAYV